MRDYHVDGLRLDAIHAIYDSSAEHIVRRARRRVHAVRADALVIAESGLNDPRVMRPPSAGGYGCDAAWADDFHHALRALLTGERAATTRSSARVAAAGQGLPPPARPRRQLLELPRAGASAPAPTTCRPERFVVFAQNHDQVGNRAFGDRLPAPVRAAGRVLHAAVAVHADAVHGRGVRRAGAVPVLLRPHRQAHRRRDARGPAPRVRRVRRVRSEEVPDPQDPATFERSKLDARARPATRASSTRELLAVRRALPPGDADAIEFDEDARLAARAARRRSSSLCNFADEPALACRARARRCSCATHEPTAAVARTASSCRRCRERWSDDARCGRGARSRWARPGTAAAPTSRSSPSTPSASSCACSTRRATRRASS